MPALEIHSKAGRELLVVLSGDVICGALSEAHANAFIHRDITTGNIFVTHRGGQYDVAKLLDFGLVKYVSSHDEQDMTQTGTFTMTNNGNTITLNDGQGNVMDMDVISLTATTMEVDFSDILNLSNQIQAGIAVTNYTGSATFIK